MYDYNTCATFLAHYITYEELEDPEKLPSVVVSPTTTLTWQAGDCFDMSVLLASLLLGAGYDAYCVIGYASLEVTTNDQSGRSSPEVILDESGEEKGKQAAKERTTKYHLRKRPDLVSKFQLREGERRRQELEKAYTFNTNVESGSPASQSFEDKGTKRVHCWILVQSGKRDIQTPFFIEPSTGDVAPLDSPAYLGVEAVFSGKNYWVNMQETKRAAMSFDLSDSSKWEYIFLSGGDANEDDLVQQERRFRENLAAEAGESGDQILDLPASWVERLSMTQQQCENRYPGLKKTITYQDAIVEHFAAYSERDLKVKRITLLNKFLKSYEVHTFFAHRIDKLRRRSNYNETEEHAAILAEWFDEGRKREAALEALSHTISEEGKRLEMHFYGKARLDGLTKRIELYHSNGDAANPRKVMEYFEGREDRLNYRSATYDPHVVAVTITTPGEKMNRTSPEEKPNPKKMTEKFDRNPEEPADQDVAKRTFYSPGSPEGTIRIIYHYAAGKITRPSRTYSKGNPVTIEHVDPFAKDPKTSALGEEMRLLFVKEKECMAAIRESEREAKDILAQRAKEEQDVGFVTTVYDTLRNKPKEDELLEQRRRLEEQQRAQKKKDYLAPYLEHLARVNAAKVPPAKPIPADGRLSREDAMKVKEACLKDLKDRLIQRAHIMQNRLDEEKEKLARKQSNFQKNQEQIDNMNQEEYIQFCENAMWRIHILEKRLERHQDQSLQKYAELDQKLRLDPRLSSLSG
eukprot:GGOE01018816.1.p1 GENE.GGOE01018816.1~~GGOE01018816.1.p1  ORF type:complete len:876 (-),score=304.14 GGOE01018816.1:111-2354(-)